MQRESSLILGIVLIFLILCSKEGYSSPQSPDLLIYNGDTVGINTLLLEQYFDQVGKNDDIEGKLFGLNFRDGASFNCWRGYQAVFEISDDTLWLKHITSCNEYFYFDSIDAKKSRERIEEIFGNMTRNGKVLVDWFTGHLSIPRAGSKILRWDGVFSRSFEQEILFKINNGVIDSVSQVQNYIDIPERINRRYGDSIVSEIFDVIKRIKWRDIDKFDCSEVYSITIGTNGLIKDIIMAEYQTEEEIQKYWDTRREYNYCLRTLRNALKAMKFDILKESGEPIEEEIHLDIWFNDDGTIENWTN